MPMHKVTAHYLRLYQSPGESDAPGLESGEFEAAWLAPVRSGVRLHFFGGSHDGCYVEIGEQGEFDLGCAEDAWFRFDRGDPVDAMVSTRHARLLVTDGETTIMALQPTNGLFLFNVEIPPGRGAPLRDGDLLRLGRGGPRIGVRIGDLSRLALAEKE